MRLVAAVLAACAVVGAQENSPVDRWIGEMTLRERVAQLVIVPFYGDIPHPATQDYQRFVTLVSETRVGGLILINRLRNRSLKRAEPYGAAAFLNRMQRLAKVPLIVGADFERGASMRVDDMTPFPHAMAFGATGDPALTRYLGEATAREARALGYHWMFVPVADVNNNPDNPVINIRSFGEDPSAVSAHVRAFVEGTRANPANQVLTTVKHFPGHGDTSIDSHLNLATTPADPARLEAVELAPFREGIAAGVDAVMTAHLAVPSLTPPDLPATLAPQILTGLLRERLGFTGLVVTDALDMKGVARGFTPGDAAVLALEAGADVLLMPPDPDAAISAVVVAIESGRISEARLNASLARLLAAKVRLGLHEERYVNIEEAVAVVEDPAALARAREIAERAVTLVRNEGALLPLRPRGGACFIVLNESRYNVTQGIAFVDEVGRIDPRASVVSLDPQMPQADLDAAAAQAAQCPKVVVVAFTNLAKYANGGPLPGRFPALLTKIVAGTRPVALVSLGNPYLVRHAPGVKAYVAAFSPVPPSETAAARALFGEIPLQGRLPVSIPGVAERGTMRANP
ncbi:MAG: glycoside hydrolase family 3 C-terminal domain-containing protein [Bryobacterales bacterium]|nr:glycoside hydrolase family 3 C-terminal domain-containing protein [Bryobacterales bacterium]